MEELPMKKLNKILSLTAASALALSLTACSGGTQGSAETPAGNSGTPATATRSPWCASWTTRP